MMKTNRLFISLTIILLLNTFETYELHGQNFDIILDKILTDFKESPRAEDIFYYENLTVPEIIKSQGYVAEIHHTVTEDGYILELHRIPYGKDGPSAEPRPVAYLEHGLLTSSFDFIGDKPDRALAYLLADAGYDVWMNNKRGNLYSRNHTTLDPDVDKRQFWEFTWDEMGIYDVPAGIDRALNVTGNTQLYYIGFSMGTTVFFVMMSERPEYADKIKASALMAPVAYVEHMKGALRLLANYSDDLDFVLSLLGYYEFLPPNQEVQEYLANNYCLEEDLTAPICYNMFFILAGYDPEELNTPYVPIYLTHAPAGTSTHTVNHYGQLVYRDVFQMYDWGRLGNQQHYGQNEPPAFNLQGPTPPIGLFWSQNDYLATPEDVARLASELQNVALNYRVEWDMWSHIDFIWGIHAKEYVYDHVLNFLAQY